MVEYLIVASSFNRFAGPNNHLLDLCNYLRNKANIDLVLLTHDTTIQDSFLKSISFPLLKCLKGAAPNPLVRLAYTPINTSIFVRAIRDLSPERVFVNSSIDTLFQTCLATHRRIKTGYNVFFNRPGTKHNMSLWEVLDHFIARSAVNRALAHTKFQKQMYTKIGIKEERITVIPHCIDINRIYNSIEGKVHRSRFLSDFDLENPIIFYGGYFGYHKGIVELVRAYEELADKISATLVLCGDGPLREWICAQKQKIEKRNIMAKIVIMPWQSSDRFLNEMNNASIFVLPSLHEFFGLVLLEAMSLKKPVITTCFEGPSEIITDRVDGLLVNPHNIHDLSEAFLELLNDSKLRVRIGLNAFKTIQRKYDVSKVAPQFIKFMDEKD